MFIRWPNLHPFVGRRLIGRRIVGQRLAARQRYSSAASARVGSADGLFCLGLHAPNDFMRIAERTMCATNRLVDQICAQEPTADSLWLLDEVSDQLCRVMDAAELCRNVHHDQDFVHAADAVCLECDHSNSIHAPCCAVTSANGGDTQDVATRAVSQRAPRPPSRHVLATCAGTPPDSRVTRLRREFCGLLVAPERRARTKR